MEPALTFPLIHTRRNVLRLSGITLLRFSGIAATVSLTTEVHAAPLPPDATRSEGRIVLWRQGHPIAIRPGIKGTTEIESEFKDKKGSIRLGPDGQTALFYLASRSTIRPEQLENRDRIYLRKIAGEVKDSSAKEIKVDGISLCHAFWGAGGRAVFGYGLALPNGPGPAPAVDLTTDFVNWSFDLRTEKVERLNLPGNVSVLDRSVDGKEFLVLQYQKPTGIPGDYMLGLLSANGKSFVPLTKVNEATPGDFLFSPDGRLAIGTVYQQRKADLLRELILIDLRTKGRTVVALPDSARVCASCWSPDGKQIAFVWMSEASFQQQFGDRVRPLAGSEKYEWTVTIAKPDGSDAHDVYTEAGYLFGSIDWR